MTRARLALGLFLCAVVGCDNGETPITQIGVSVVSNLKVPSEIDLLTIDVSGITQPMSARKALKDDSDLPGTLTIVRDSGASGPITIRAAAWLGEDKVVEQSIYVSFKPNRTTNAVISLERACAHVFCDDGMTCDSQNCVPIEEVGSEPGTAGHGSNGSGGMGASGIGASGIGASGIGASGMGSGGKIGASGRGGMGASGHGSGGNIGASGSGGITGTGGSPQNPPTCTILTPSVGDSYDLGDPIVLTALCSDPGGGMITYGWNSSLQGAIGDKRRVTVTNLQLGSHMIDVCATDSNNQLMGCSNTVAITVTMPSAPTAMILSVTQQQGNSHVPPPFVVGSPLDFIGMGTGKNLTYQWSDSFAGDFATSAVASIATPEIGNHIATFEVTDSYGRSDSATFSFVVLPTGQSTLSQSFTAVNAALNGAVLAMAVDSTSHVLAGDSTTNLYRFDATNLSATPETVLTSASMSLPGRVRALLLSEADNRLYLGTDGGLVICSYTAGMAITGCSTFAGTTFMNGDLPDNQVNVVARFIDSTSAEHLVLGTKKGLWLTTTLSGLMTGTTIGSVALADKEITGVVSINHVLWITTAQDGLYSFDPVADSMPSAHAGASAPSQKLSSIALDANGLFWIGSDAGFASFDPGASGDPWTVWTSASDPAPHLIGDHVQAVGTARVMIGSTRDVVWLGTDSGVSRFDSTTPTFMNLTMTDGLPSDNVTSIAFLANGNKLFGTSAGIALYVGN